MDAQSIFLILAYVAEVIIAIVVLRYALSVPTLVKNSKAQTALLAEIALKQGADDAVVKYIIDKAK